MKHKHGIFSITIGILIMLGLQCAWLEVIGWSGLAYTATQGGSAFDWYASLAFPPVVFAVIVTLIVHLLGLIFIEKRRLTRIVNKEGTRAVLS